MSLLQSLKTSSKTATDSYHVRTCPNATSDKGALLAEHICSTRTFYQIFKVLNSCLYNYYADLVHSLPPRYYDDDVM